MDKRNSSSNQIKILGHELSTSSAVTYCSDLLLLSDSSKSKTISDLPENKLNSRLIENQEQNQHSLYDFENQRRNVHLRINQENLKEIIKPPPKFI